ncbi:hypothetical protein ACFWGD_02685 [Corynebacterium sp. NPDC060344]|uniref:hypothetical protein n=1 Tax=Corynebacterium sp. NPDC060344 TaxID=3347101 RepID=UPI00364DAE29
MNDIRNRAINWVLVERPRLAAKIIRKLTASGSSHSSARTSATPPTAATGTTDAATTTSGGASATPATAAKPLTRDNGLRAANIAAGVPGAE